MEPESDEEGFKIETKIGNFECTKNLVFHGDEAFKEILEQKKEEQISNDSYHNYYQSYSLVNNVKSIIYKKG